MVNRQSNVKSEMALRLSKQLERSPESRLIMQICFDLWQAQKRIDLKEVETQTLVE